jgi:hypothetical protein
VSLSASERLVRGRLVQRFTFDSDFLTEGVERFIEIYRNQSFVKTFSEPHASVACLLPFVCGVLYTASALPDA